MRSSKTGNKNDQKDGGGGGGNGRSLHPPSLLFLKIEQSVITLCVWSTNRSGEDEHTTRHFLISRASPVPEIGPTYTDLAANCKSVQKIVCG